MRTGITTDATRLVEKMQWGDIDSPRNATSQEEEFHKEAIQFEKRRLECLITDVESLMGDVYQSRTDALVKFVQELDQQTKEFLYVNWFSVDMAQKKEMARSYMQLP